MRNKDAINNTTSTPDKTMPLAEERITVSKEKIVDRRIQISRKTVTDEQLIETELSREEAIIHRVSKNEIIQPDKIPTARQEGDIYIIPVIREEVEIIRRQVLVEEIHVKKILTSEHFQESVELRRQELDISTDKED
ncbi:YsnF/AvaK domain-containing protein [Superficieibacter sp. HKU1]|uniref:YsnF/AvaK domain-containing protein n=1 Tax=Superficieibacter sp. HKU1 TaxID=3031919 RepID=UPI0023E32996|nr:YsnF/AvaK domain-containing protein [Superficieibacter sp. HKU1]WES70361.1 YsnF/AvaK domain-containing protein [Superficieibacter sp. HKU1]